MILCDFLIVGEYCSMNSRLIVVEGVGSITQGLYYII